MDKHLDAETLSDYAEGLLDAAARAAADGHLAACADCRRQAAAVQAYFRELGGLEPARAPADFLAKVRARLPGPSPWRRAWAAILLPLRAIPAPIAVAVLFGVTAITIYIRQGGAPDRDAAVPLSATAPESPRPEASPPGLSAPEASGPIREATAPQEAPIGTVSAASGGAPVGASAGDAVPAKTRAKAAAGGDAKPVKSAEPENAPTSPSLSSSKPILSVTSGHGSLTAYDAIASRAGEVKDLDALLSKSPSAPSAEKKRAAARSPAAAPEPAAPVARQDVPVSPPPAAAPLPEKPKVKAAPEASLALSRASDTLAVLAGLRAMGAAAEAEAATSPSERRFRLRVPASMASSLAPYLARYGRAQVPEPGGPAGDTAVLRLKILLPAP